MTEQLGKTMKQLRLTEKYQRRLASLTRYSAKRRTLKWKRRKKSRKILVKIKYVREAKQKARLPISVVAPKDFSLIKNTDAVLKYFADAAKKINQGENIELDMGDIERLSPETIALLVASINDRDFCKSSTVMGNAPRDETLKKILTESGFYDHVISRGSFKAGDGNLMHKEVHHRVEGEIAKKALIFGLRHVFGRSRNFFDPLYNILIECMSNTNNHADLFTQGKCRWWLFVYCDPDQKITSYTFVDLGVGIFGSTAVKSRLQSLLKTVGLYPNVNLVDDLLAGKIKSRAARDNEIRGKGIPQIAKAAKSENFRSFYIIANDVIIDLKTEQRRQLKYALNGTMLHWELQR